MELLSVVAAIVGTRCTIAVSCLDPQFTPLVRTGTVLSDVSASGRFSFRPSSELNAALLPFRCRLLKSLLLF